MKLTVLDVSTGRHVTGQLVKRYPNGLTIDDQRGVRYYVTNDKVIDEPAPTDLFEWMEAA